MGPSQPQDSEHARPSVTPLGQTPRDAIKDDEYGEGMPLGSVARTASLVCLALFSAALLGTAGIDTCWPAEELQLVGAERVARERARASASLWDGTLARDLEDRLRARSRVREEVMPWYSFQLFQLLDEGAQGVAVGQDHWMFLERRCRLKPFPDDALARSCTQSVIALDRRLAAREIELTVLPIPRKSYVAHDYLPRHLDGRAAVDDLLIGGLLERGVETVDLRDSYRALDPGEVYLKLDTHWTPRAARIAAQEVAASSDLPREGGEPLGRLTLEATQTDSQRNVATLISIGARPDAEDLASVGFVHPPRTRIHLPTKVFKWFRSPTPTVPIALAGTSFSHQQRLGQVIAHYAGEPVFDGSRPALPHMTTLAQVLEAYDGTRPLERLVWEFPIAVAFDECTNFGIRHGSPVTRALAAVPPPSPRTVLDVPEELLRATSSRPLQGRGKRATLMTIPGGWLAHSGDGVLDLVLEGEWSGERCELVLQCGATATKHVLPKGPFTLSFPVLGSSKAASLLTLTAALARGEELLISDARLTLQGVGPLVALEGARLEGATVLTSSSPTPPLGRRPALLVQLKEGDRAKVGPLTVEVWTQGAEQPQRVTIYGVRPGALIALDLGQETGNRLSSVSLVAPRWELEIESAELSLGS